MTGTTEPWILQKFRGDAEFRKQLSDLRALQDAARQQPRSSPRKFTSFEISRLEAMFGTLEPTVLDWISTFSESVLQAVINPPTIHTRMPQSPEMKKCLQVGGFEASKAPPKQSLAQILAGKSEPEKLLYMVDVGDGEGHVLDLASGQWVLDLRRLHQ